jgi:hypothetical protein
MASSCYFWRECILKQLEKQSAKPRPRGHLADGLRDGSFIGPELPLACSYENQYIAGQPGTVFPVKRTCY